MSSIEAPSSQILDISILFTFGYISRSNIFFTNSRLDTCGCLLTLQVDKAITIIESNNDLLPSMKQFYVSTTMK
jgi:hypothetical protein